jgi:Fe2+ or Zn2+ uptake regulation protein
MPKNRLLQQVLPPDFSPEAILNRLRAGGMRITAARRGIIDVLFQAKAPLSPEI